MRFCCRCVLWFAAVLAPTFGCAQFSQPSSQASAQAPGTSDWWAKNRHRAVFVPGQGNQIAGVEGFYDDDGRAIDGGAVVPSSSPYLGPGENKKSWADLLDPSYAYGRVKESLGPARDEAKARQRFAAAEALFLEKKFAEAHDLFVEAGKLGRDTAVQEDAMFMAGESLFFADKYPKANNAYDKLIALRPNSRYLDKVVQRQFAIAHFWHAYHDRHGRWPYIPNLTNKTLTRFDTKGHSIRTYNNIRLNDPTGPLADDALMAIANSHFLSGRFADADYHYDLLRKEYPESDHQYEAHILGLQCKLQKYQGPDYDGKPLEEAEKLTEQLLVQFPDQIAKDRERVNKTRGEVAALVALRDWKLGNYHEGRSEFGSARYYYDQIVEKHPTTKLGEEARARIASFAGKPDKPPQRVAWLTDLFPGEADPLQPKSDNPVQLGWLKQFVPGDAGGATVRR